MTVTELKKNSMAFKMKKSPIKDMSELRARQRRMSRGESEFQYRNRMRRKASAEAKRNALPTDILTKNIADITQKGDEQIRAKMTATVPQAPKPSPKQTFKQAFADARKAGKKTFIFEGNPYTTKLKKKKSTKGDSVVNIQLDPEKPNFGAVSRVPFQMKGMTFKGKSPVRNDKNVLITENTENTAVTGGTTEFGKKDFSKHPSVKRLINAGAPKNVISAQIKKLKNKAKKNI